MIHLQIAEKFSSQIDWKLVRQAAEIALLRQTAPQSGTLTIVITDDTQLRRLNHQYLGIDASTDVLSFPSDESDPDTGELYLGDILISYPQAKSQAAQGRHSIEAELQLLTVHGILHLLGHNHTEKEDKQRMWSVQAEILSLISEQLSVTDH